MCHGVVLPFKTETVWFFYYRVERFHPLTRMFSWILFISTPDYGVSLHPRTFSTTFSSYTNPFLHCFRFIQLICFYNVRLNYPSLAKIWKCCYVSLQNVFCVFAQKVKWRMHFICIKLMHTRKQWCFKLLFFPLFDLLVFYRSCFAVVCIVVVFFA